MKRLGDKERGKNNVGCRSVKATTFAERKATFVASWTNRTIIHQSAPLGHDLPRVIFRLKRC
jgi:hypothetical protein